MNQVFKKTPRTETEKKILNAALVGNPNCGKTTLFNALTGLHQKVANYPGVTVERKSGKVVDAHGTVYRLIDLPGLYSIASRSLDEQIAADVIRGKSPHEPPLDVIIVAADATNLERSLYLCSQVVETGIPTILVLNMMDVARKQNIKIDIELLASILNLPVVPAVAKKGIGIAELRQALTELQPSQTPSPPIEKIKHKKARNGSLGTLTNWLAENEHLTQTDANQLAVKICTDEEFYDDWIHQKGSKEGYSTILSLRSQIIENNAPHEQEEIQARFASVDQITRRVVSYPATNERSLNDKIDRFLTHKILGPVIMFIVLSAIFQTVYSWSELPMTWIESMIGSAGELVRQNMAEGILRDLMVDGIIAGVGAVLVFLPQIMLLFLFVSTLEDSGYLSRVAFILDRAMARIGLSGQSVIPLLSSFACAIPGIMAARTIHNSKDRLITILVAPFMSCSARLPVYTLMIGAFIPPIWFGGIFYLPAFTLLCLYIIGVVVSIISAAILGKFVIKGQSSNFIMELPPYRIPVWKFVFLRVYEAGRTFVKNAGKIILSITIILWFLASYPRDVQHDSQHKLDNTFAGKIGHFIEPAIKPLGFDWKIGVGLVTSFAAREVMVSTLGTLYNIQDADEASVGLRQAMQKDINPDTGKPVFTPLTAISLMVFFVLACQCVSTLAIIRRETNTWRWPAALFFYMLILAYTGSFIVFQLGSFLGFA